MKLTVAACAFALSLAPLSARAAKVDPVPVHFSGKLLDGTAVTVPDAANGKPCFVVVGTTRKSGDAIAQWSNELYKRAGDRAKIYSIALLDKVPGIFRGMVVGSLRRQYDSPDGKAPSYFLVAYDGTDIRRLAPSGNEDDPITYVFDANGALVASYHRPYSDDAVATAVKALGAGDH